MCDLLLPPPTEGVSRWRGRSVSRCPWWRWGGCPPPPACPSLTSSATTSSLQSRMSSVSPWWAGTAGTSPWRFPTSRRRVSVTRLSTTSVRRWSDGSRWRSVRDGGLMRILFSCREAGSSGKLGKKEGKQFSGELSALTPRRKQTPVRQEATTSPPTPPPPPHSDQTWWSTQWLKLKPTEKQNYQRKISISEL